MTLLKPGSHGHEVMALQNRLLELGFAPGACDGIFGPSTRDAVSAFQRSVGLKADGDVGPQSGAALQKASSNPAPVLPTTLDIPLDVAQRMFPQAKPSDIEANLPSVLFALQAAKQTDLHLVLAALATIRAEVASFRPEEEGPSPFNTSHGGQPFDLYDNRRDLGNLGPGDGAAFRGRGFVQLTGRANYVGFGPVAGEPDLVSQPQLACDTDVAASLLAAYIKRYAPALKTALLNNDFAQARRLVNGGANGLEQFTDAYRTGMTLLSH